MLRCVQLGISISDLELLSIGLVTDMYVEMSNDSEEEEQEAAQGDFDNF